MCNRGARPASPTTTRSRISTGPWVPTVTPRPIRASSKPGPPAACTAPAWTSPAAGTPVPRSSPPTASRRSRRCWATARPSARPATATSWAWSWAARSSRWTSPSTAPTGRSSSRRSPARRWPGGRPSSSAPLINRMIDDFADEGRADLVRQLLFPFPVAVIAALLGLPAEDLPEFHRLAVELIGVTVDWDRSGGQLGQAARVLLQDRRRPAQPPGRRHDLGAGHGRAGRAAPHRRGDLRLPAPAAAGRRRDHLPLVVEPALRAADPPRPVRRAVRRPLAHGVRPSRRASAGSRRC